MEFFLNTYLNYYEPTKMKDGKDKVFEFLSDWFIRECMWSSKSSIKEYATSVKKFYKCMSDNNHISNEVYEDLCDEIKENMDYFVELMDDYDNGNFVYPFQEDVMEFIIKEGSSNDIEKVIEVCKKFMKTQNIKNGILSI